MNMTDPIADMLTRIRNGGMARHQSVLIPTSKMKLSIARILKDEGYIKDFDFPGEEGNRQFRVWLKYGADKKPVVTGLKRVSKPGLRVYTNAPRSPSCSAAWAWPSVHVPGRHVGPRSVAQAPGRRSPLLHLVAACCRAAGHGPPWGDPLPRTPAR